MTKQRALQSSYKTKQDPGMTHGELGREKHSRCSKGRGLAARIEHRSFYTATGRKESEGTAYGWVMGVS